jgi:predicted nucleotidyltransferase
MQSKQDIIDKIEQILSPVESIHYAFLFGSALANLRADSDVDILFGGHLDFDNRIALTARLAIALKREVDLVPAEAARSEVVIKAMSKGILIFAKNNDGLKHDYLINQRRLDDSTSLRRIKLERIKRQYANG